MLLAIAVLAFFAFTGLLAFGKIGEASYCFLLAGTALVALVVKGFNRLRELDLKNLKIVLADIERAKDELAVREERFKSVLIPLIQVIAYAGAAEGRLSSRESAKLRRQWYQKKLEILVNQLGVESAEAKEIQKFINKYAEIDNLFGERGGLKTTDPDYQQVKEKIEALSNQINEMLRQDIVNK